jgi:hypothetical protein
VYKAVRLAKKVYWNICKMHLIFFASFHRNILHPETYIDANASDSRRKARGSVVSFNKCWRASTNFSKNL